MPGLLNFWKRLKKVGNEITFLQRIICIPFLNLLRTILSREVNCNKDFLMHKELV